CAAYRALLARIGSGPRVLLQPRLRVPVLSPGRPAAVLRRGILPAPLHMLGSLARYRHLRPRERLRAVRAAIALSRLDLGERALASAGVEVRLGWRAEALQTTSAGITVRGASEALGADVAILAVPHARAAALLSGLLPDVALKLAALESSPIVNLHVVYDRVVCEEPFAAGVRTPGQYLVYRTA